jgi:putative transposase
MARRRYKAEEIMAKLREAEVLLGRGKKVAEVVKELGIHEVTYYRWRKEYGGMRVDQMKRPTSSPYQEPSSAPSRSVSGEFGSPRP